MDFFGIKPKRAAKRKRKIGPIFKPVKLATKKNVRRIPKKNLTWPQAVKKYPKITMFGDADRDGKLNMFDCKPFDKKRHGYTRNQTIINKRMKAIHKGGDPVGTRWVLSDGTKISTEMDHRETAKKVITLKRNAKKGTGELGGDNISAIAALQKGAGAIRTYVNLGGGINIDVLSKQKITEEQKKTLRNIHEEVKLPRVYYDIEPDEVGGDGESGYTEDIENVFDKHEEYYKKNQIKSAPEILQDYDKIDEENYEKY